MFSKHAGNYIFTVHEKALFYKVAILYEVVWFESYENIHILENS